jgi:5-methyltetrahydropteroyltriglutamate--homocysteine methyltransferase
MRKIVDVKLPTTMVGSDPRPRWFTHQLHGQDIHQAFKLEAHAEAYADAVAAAVRDQEQAGLDVVTDGQMYFDDYGGSIGSFVWYWYERLPGFDTGKRLNPIAEAGRTDTVDYALLTNWGGTTTTGKVGRGPVRLAELYSIARAYASRPLKVCVGAGPLNLGFHVDYELPEAHYRSHRDLSYDLVPVFNAEMKELVQAGASFLQLEDLGAWIPVMSKNDADAQWVVDVVNRTIEGVDAKIGWHFCLGNSYGNANVSVFGGMLERILPPLYDTRVETFVLDFALRGMADVAILKTLPKDKEVYAGVIDVRSLQIESAEQVADRMRRVLEVVPAERVGFTTDCGLRALPRIVAQQKLKSMAGAARVVRGEL